MYFGQLNEAKNEYSLKILCRSDIDLNHRTFGLNLSVQLIMNAGVQTAKTE